MSTPDAPAILVVDDKPANLTALRSLLADLDARVVTAGSGDQALALMLEHDFALMLLDVDMPGMDGYEVAEMARSVEATREVPIIFVTAAYDDMQHRVRGYRSGAVDYIEKPIPEEILRSKVRVFLDLYNSRRRILELNAEYRRAEEAAQAANRAKSAFLANMSHELRTPLNAITGYTQILLRSRRLDPTSISQLQVIRRASDHLLEMISELLDLSKIESGHLSLEPGPMRLLPLLEDLCAMFRPRCDEKGLSYQCHFPEGLPEGLLGDHRRLRQMAINLLGNAVKFTHAGGIEFGVAYRDGQLHLWVQDSGPGIPAAELERIFAPFVQVPSSELTEGTGLGLAITRRLARLMGGEVEVASELGRGSRFELVLPLARVRMPEPFQASLPLPAAEVSGYRRRDGHAEPLRLLVVDDKEDNRAVLVQMLNVLGFVIDEAQSGEECLERVANHPPDLILLDLVMPGMGGLEAARRLHSGSTTAQIPLIACSARVFPEDRLESKAVGCVAHLTKPVTLPALLEVLQQHLPLSWNGQLVQHNRQRIQAISDALASGSDSAFEQAVGDLEGELEGMREPLLAWYREYAYPNIYAWLQGQAASAVAAPLAVSVVGGEGGEG